MVLDGNPPVLLFSHQLLHFPPGGYRNCQWQRILLGEHVFLEFQGGTMDELHIAPCLLYFLNHCFACICHLQVQCIVYLFQSLGQHFYAILYILNDTYTYQRSNCYGLGCINYPCFYKVVDLPEVYSVKNLR
jgi:hypothetical protein